MTQEELQKRLEELEKELRILKSGFRNVSEIDPQIRRTIEQIVGNASSFNEDSYDQVVNEAGILSYEVPRDFDGLSLINGKLYGYYNP